MSSGVVVERAENSLIVCFNRPEIRNPLSIDILDEVARILSGLSGDEKVIFTGKGEVFASGADLREIAAATPETAREFAYRGQGLMATIASLPQMTIAGINGHCFGGALDLALACDRRIASPNAKFAHPGTGLGIITGWGGTQRLPRLIGEGNALEMLFTATPIKADRALQIGLIGEIADDVITRAMQFFAAA